MQRVSEKGMSRLLFIMKRNYIITLAVSKGTVIEGQWKLVGGGCLF